MARGSVGIAVTLVAVGLAWSALAGEENGGVDATVLEPFAASVSSPVFGDLRDRVRMDLMQQRVLADRTRVTVERKLGDAKDARTARARMAYRVLRPQLDLGGLVGGDRERWLSSARANAATRFLLARDRTEVALLDDESRRLLGAATRLASDVSATANLPALVVTLAWPVHGTIARDFGRFAHERSGTQLARRGVDLDVEEHAEVHSSGAGRVLYAGAIRGLDDGVIVDHGAYITVVGKLADLSVSAHATITAGQTLGRAARKRVYFEVRLPIGPGGTPIRPGLVMLTPAP